MPNDLINHDPMVSQYFYLEIDGENIILSGVSGLDIELDVVALQQNGKDGKQQLVKTLGGTNKTGDLSVTRMAPGDSEQDPIWKWFKAIRDKGFSLDDRTRSRKNGSVVLFDSTHKEVGRFNFVNGWPSKISTDQLSTDGNEPVKETITLTIERLDRIK
jgi:phage tail-like protein